VERREAAGCALEIYDVDTQASLRCLPREDPATLSADPDILAIGVGAFGETGFGEFLAVAGNAACQPTDGANCADYMVASGNFVPRLTALLSVTCRGRFSRLVRFESDPARGPAPFSGIVAGTLTLQAGVDVERAVIGTGGVDLPRMRARQTT